MLLPLLAREGQTPAIRQQLVSLRNWAPGGAAAAAGAACSRGAGALPAGLGAAAGQLRSMWGEPPSREEVMHRDSFYDNVRRRVQGRQLRPGLVPLSREAVQCCCWPCWWLLTWKMGAQCQKSGLAVQSG